MKSVLALSGLAVVVLGGFLWLQGRDFFWRSPIEDARFQPVTDFEGVEQAAAVSRDGKFLAFLSDRGGQTDVWVTQVGSGQFHNLTHGSAPELLNPSVRTLGFSPDGSQVMFWVRRQDGTSGGAIGIWAVPTLGGEPRPYLEGVAEFDWLPDGSRLAYHTPGPGDPLFVTENEQKTGGRMVFAAPAGLHSHFPLWSPDGEYLYFVQGALPDKLDVWRIRSAGGPAERITAHDGRVTHPVLLNKRTLLYLASDPDGSGPWLYAMDVERRIAHRLNTGIDRYTSLAASGDGRRIAVTLASPKRTLWRLAIPDSNEKPGTMTQIPLPTGKGFSPRLGADYLLYVSSTGTGESLWKLTNGIGTELWGSAGARMIGAPSISPDGRLVAFSVRHQGKALLYVMRPDGTNARVVSDSLELLGSPAWTPDGKWITSAADDHGVPHLFRVPVEGGLPSILVSEYAMDPTWAPDGRFVVYSGPDVGTTFPVKAAISENKAYPLPPLALTRGARHVAFATGGRSLVVLRGEIRHKDLWLIDLQTGVDRKLTDIPSDFDIQEFDLSSDGKEVVLERVQERSGVAMAELSDR
jgi:Tol biopolymer transport system component